MVNSSDEKKNNVSSKKRSTISLKNTNSSGPFPRVSGNSNTFEVEIKRKRHTGLATDFNNSRRGGRVSLRKDASQSNGKLTDQEFQARIRALKEAMKESVESVKEEENEKSDIIRGVEDIQHEDSHKIISKDRDIENEGVVVQENNNKIDNKLEDNSSKKNVKFNNSKHTNTKKDEVINNERPVVFRANDYVRKHNDTPKNNDNKRSLNNSVSKDKSPRFNDNSENIEKSARESNYQQRKQQRSQNSRRDIDDDDNNVGKNRNSSKSDVKKSFGVKKSDNNSKKISRAVLNRVLDNDLEERTRSVASFKRAKQKLKNINKDQDSTKVVRTVDIPDMITISDLSNRMAVRAGDVIKYLMKLGTLATLNQSIDGDTAEIICTDFGHIPNRVSDSDIEKDLEKIVDNPEDLETRAPIVTVMGHVDHGKTTLLDTLRKTSIAQKEAGGITQHVSAYQISNASGNKITFIDTPGHAAFSQIRSRGAVLTDIIVLVVSADDGIKDQTIEAIDHAKKNNVPIVVAINKIDKPNVNVDRVKTDLMNHEIIVEDFGGEVLSVEISALKNINLDKLIDAILLQAEVMQLKSNPNRKAVGTILDSRIVKGRGIVASVVVQHGTLKTGDIFVAGASYGKVRSIYSDGNKKINEAGPSSPIEIVGFNSASEPGDTIYVVDSEQQAREIAEYRARKIKEKSSISHAVSIDQLMAGQKNTKKELNIITKADVYGSLEALISSIESINHDEVCAKIVEQGVGMINESDVDFAHNTGSVIIGFNVGATSSAKDLAHSYGIQIYSNSVIYHILEEVKRMMSDLLPPIIEENYIGKAEVRKIFVISRFGTIAGCYVTDGLIKRSDSKIKVLRGGKIIFEGKIRSMKHEKNEIKESRQSYECGILAEGYNDFQEGDVIECYEITQKSRSI